jgi:outer membrane protein TolC
VDAAEAQVQLARREIWPDLTVGIQYGQSRLTMPPTTDAQGIPMPAERRTERMASLMIGASLPVFARSRQLQMRNEMSAMRRMAEADLAAMRAETRGAVARAHADLTRARALARLYHTTVLPQAEATVESSLAAYRVGGVDFMTLLDSRMAVNEYRQELLALVADEGRAWAELEMLVGRELINANSVAAGPSAVGGAR